MNRRGFTLIEIAIALIVMSGLLFAAMRIFSLSGKWSKRSEEKDRMMEETRLLGFQLQKFLEGGRSFQNLSLRIPGTTLSCPGIGLCVDPDKDVLGNASPGNDVLYVVNLVPLNPGLQIKAPFPSSGSLQFTTMDGTTPVGSLLHNTDFVVLNNVQSSEILQLIADPASSVIASITLGAAAYLPTYQKPGATIPGLRGTYAEKDLVYRAKLIKVGIHASQEIRSVDIQTSNVSVLARKIRGFNVSYTLTSKVPAACASIVAPDTFSRSQWALINANECHAGISQLKVEYEAESPSGNRKESYIFPTAH